MASARHWEQDKEATVYVGQLDERVTDSMVWELMLQAGRIVNVYLPKDRVTQIHQGYGFVEFISEEDADYAAKIMNGVRLYGKAIRVNKASADKQKTVEVGAELFVGNLDPMVDEKTLYDTFGRFGSLVSAPKIARDDLNISKCFGFVSFSNFEASDAAIANMNGQYLMNKEISVQYAYKKDGKGERHGDTAERTIAAEGVRHNIQPNIQPLPAQLFGEPAPSATIPIQNGGPPNMGYMPNGNFPRTYNMAPPASQTPQPPPRPMAQAPLAPPSSSLPARPPRSQVAFNGPPGGMPPNFSGPGQNPLQGGSPQPPFGAPPGMPPPGPPGMAPGFQPNMNGSR